VVSLIIDDGREHPADLFEPAAQLGAITDRHRLRSACDAQAIAIKIGLLISAEI
jgi:hypothetical protein